MKVSIIIPCKNRLDHLQQTLPLVLSQDYPDFEVIVVDYNCPQNTYEWVRGNVSPNIVPIKAFVGKDEWSLSAARNLGYKHSNGEMLLFLDADARITDKNFLKRHVEHCIDGSFICGWGASDATGCLMLRRSAFEAVNGYNELLKAWGAEDIQIYNRLQFAVANEKRIWLGGIETIKHDDSIRNEYHGKRDIWQTNDENFKVPKHKGLRSSKLYILTLAFRYELLSDIAKTIPESENVEWIICKSSRREKITAELPKNARIIEVDVEDVRDQAIHKLHALTAQVKDGYFMILDDDNEIHPDMFSEFEHTEKNMLIGKQVRADGSTYLNPAIPSCGHIDAGNVICHHSALKECDFNNLEQYDCPDGMFWKRCYDYFKGQKIELISETMFYYNKLR